MPVSRGIVRVVAGMVAAAGIGLAAPSSSAPVTLTLEQAYDRALSTDQAIRIAFYEVKKANLLPWSALTRIAPQISGNVGYNRREDTRETRVTTTTVSPTASGSGTSSNSGNSGTSSATGGNGTATSTSSTSTSSGTGSSTSTGSSQPLGRTTYVQTNRSRSGVGTADISLSQPLIDFTVFPAYRLGKLSAQAAYLQQRFTVRETLFGVASAYYEVLKQQRLVEVNKQAFDLANQQFELAQNRASVGEVTRTDVLRAQVSLETARRAVVESTNALELNWDTLRNILNLPPDQAIRVVEPPNSPEKIPDFPSLLHDAFEHREDLMVKRIAIEQDIQRREEVLGQYFPRVVAQLNAGVGNTTGTSRSNNDFWSADISVELPFFTGGQREIDVKTTGYQIEQTRLEKEQQAKQVETDVRTAWLNVQTLSETLKALRVQVQAAEQSYIDLKAQYAAGTATSVDVLSALNDLNTSRKDLAVQTYDYQVALRSIDQARGTFQTDRVQRAKVK